MKDKKGFTITNVFQNIFDGSNKLWVENGSDFYNKSMKSCLQDKEKEMYLTHNEGISVLVGKFIKISISKGAYIDQLADS